MCEGVRVCVGGQSGVTEGEVSSTFLLPSSHEAFGRILC